VPKPIEEVIEVHAVADDEDYAIAWIHTHGMNALGMPELEMLEIPGHLIDSAGGFLNRLANVVRSRWEKEGESLLGRPIRLDPVATFVLRKAKAFDGDCGHHEVPVWEVRGERRRRFRKSKKSGQP
jgi:hypothetical protein